MQMLANTTEVYEYNVTTDRSVRTKFLHPRLQQILNELREECRHKHVITPVQYEGQTFCNWTVDGWGGCWGDTMAGARSTIRCPDIPNFNPEVFVHQECTTNGTWEMDSTSKGLRTIYSSCLQETVIDNTDIYIFVGGFSLSLVMLIISLAIFFKFRQLRCDRITIHKNLFLSYVFTGLLWILYYVLVTIDGTVILENPLWCKVLHVLCQYFMVCNFMWMFCEGLYLNTIMVYAFSSGKTLIVCCYIVGWGLPVILSSTYAGVRASSEEDSKDCWVNESSLQWIMYGPIVFSIVVNILFLINIVRLLITKLRQVPEASQTRKATRATLILVPLLGIQYLLMPMKPNPGSNLNQLYHLFVALMTSLQGAFVSIIYCFCNGEVLAVMRRKWNQHQLMKGNSLRSTSHGATTTYTTIDPVTQTNPTSYYSTVNNKKCRLQLYRNQRSRGGRSSPQVADKEPAMELTTVEGGES